MALIKIKQINNTPATLGAIIAFDGTNNIWTNNDTGAILVSSGTTAQRPGSPVDGFIRNNITTNKLEMYQAGVWVNLDSASIAVEDSTVNITSALSTLDFGTNLTVTDNGGGDVTIDAAGALITTVTTFAGLPGSPSTNDQVFYTPFNSVMTYDGTEWVGPKIAVAMFGREGTGNGDVWLQAIGRASSYPDGTTTHGYTIPNITVGSGTSKWKLYNMSIGSVNDCTGDMELHADATANSPVFGTTGLGLISMTADRRATSDFTPVTIDGGQSIQCFWRRTSGGWKAWTTTLTYSWVAAA